VTLSIEERDRRLSRCCKTCGKCMNSLAKNAKYCTKKCVAESKVGTERHDCRKPITCPICQKAGLRSHRKWWNESRKMCRACAEITPKKCAESNKKNRRYKTCICCGFVGYGAKQFPHPFNGLCVACWRLNTGYPVKISVNNEWDEWANKEGNRFFKKARRQEKLEEDQWRMWAKNKQVCMANRMRKVSRSRSERATTRTWDDCIQNRMYKLSQRIKHQNQSAWDKKVKSWQSSLTRRLNQRHVKKYET